MRNRNTQIRAAIINYVTANGPTNSRALIKLMAARFHTTKQRICGNLSFMICRQGSLNLVSNRPNSYVYI